MSKTCWDKLNVENETRPLFLTTNGLTMSSKTKVSRGKLKNTLLYVGIGNEFKECGSSGNKEIDRCKYINFFKKNICSSKEMGNKVKSSQQNGRTVISCMYDQGLISRIYKELKI